ncbi:hypothetical protein MVEG_00668 [Podila verticillata NRRL 6337]|nr:hypothetical protein MVEG_00668 [Podila verticillata NRRL 6337]
MSGLLHNAYLQLGGLRQLQHLTLVRSEMSRQRERGGGYFELSLRAGLDKMAACKRMVTVRFEPVGLYSLQKEELKWFAKHWPVLETVCGYHCDELGRDMFRFR